MRISVAADAFCQIVLWQWHRSSSKSVMRLLCSSSGKAAKLWPCCYHHKLVEDIIFAPLCRQHPLEFHTPLSYRYLTDDAKAVNGVTITLTVLSKLKTNFFGSAQEHPLFQAQLVHTKVFFVTQHQRIIEIIILQVLSLYFTLGQKPTFYPEIPLILIFQKCEFCEKLNFRKVNFVINAISER